MNLQFKRLTAGASTPRRATIGSAGWDITVDTTDWSINALAYGVSVTPNRPISFRTGLAFVVPDDHVLLVFSRSGHAFKSNTRLANCVGVIDSDYRGELMVRLTCDYGQLIVNSGDRIAQAVLLQLPRANLVEVEHLPQTARGTGGLGSTGA